MYKMNVIWRRFDCLPSTNDYIRAQTDCTQDTIVLVKRQSGGKGTKGRSFSSEEGGVYLTALRFYDNLPISQAFTIMTRAATAVCKTLEGLGLQPKIKWPNDVYVNGKKICGILIENTLSGTFVRKAIVGIGLNIYNQLPKELQTIATTVLAETGVRYDVDETAEKLVHYLYQDGVEKAYYSYLGWIGETVRITQGEQSFAARLNGVDEQGNLLAEVDGKVCRFAAAEVSVCV
jgi:BirA family biotin operon repressor/biotin-[acetyl-CoA-carboxylase] ligase